MGANISRPAADARVVLDAVRWIVQAIRESSRRAERTVGLSGAQLFVLRAIAETPALSLNQLARRTRTHQSSVSVVVSRLVRRRLVRRERSADDRRRLVLGLTASGAALVARSPDVVQERLIAAIERQPRRRRQALATALGGLAAAVAGGRRHPPMFLDGPERRARTRRG